MPTQLIDIADDLCSVLAGKRVRSQALSDFFGSASGIYYSNKSERQKALNDWRSQHGIPQACKTWKEAKKSSCNLEVDASQFIRSVLSAIPDDHGLISYQNIAGHSLSQNNQWNDATTCRPEKKDGWTLHFTLSGSGRYNCLREPIETGEGDLMLFSPDSYLECQRSEQCESWEFYWLLFQGDARVIDLLDWPEIGSGIYRLTIKNKETLNELRSVIDELTDINSDQGSFAERIRATLIEHFLLRCWQHVPTEVSHRKDHRIEDAIHYMEENLCNEICIEKVAEKACMSSSRLSVLFKEETGVSVMQWREERRMRMACDQLLNSNASISSIADNIGFQDSMYFSRSFKKQFGKSPKAYRDSFS